MGKTQEESMGNPFISKESELHSLTRLEEETCYKDMKANALEFCQLPIKGKYVFRSMEKRENNKLSKKFRFRYLQSRT
jgi:hypothetical protein